MLNNNLSYTQLAFTFAPQKGSYYVRDDTDAFFLFLPQEILISVSGLFSPFFFFFFRNILASFASFFSKLFFLFLIIGIVIFVIFAYRKKNYKKMFLLVFLYEYFLNFFERLSSYFFIHIPYLVFLIKMLFIRICFIGNFFIRIFSWRIIRNFCIISNILSHIFFFNNKFF